MLAFGKLLVVLGWLAAVSAFWLPEDHGWAPLGRLLFFVLLGVHAFEALVFLPRLRAAGGSLAGHVVQTLLFGFLHVGMLPDRSAR
jgi:uncharacterized protein YhhL (DUF1145 family)